MKAKVRLGGVRPGSAKGLILWTLLLLPALMSPFVLGASQDQINLAIQKGLAYLAAIQYDDGGFPGDSILASTAVAVNAFENEGHFPDAGTVYSSHVQKGLDYILGFCTKVSIDAQAAGNPDSNGNGQGVYFPYYSPMYEIGMVIPAIVASNRPDKMVPSGDCSGMTYRQVVEDAVDYIAWAQNDVGTGRGGWSYGPNDPTRSDNSISQWPVLALIAAEQWGIDAPDFVKTELDFWVNYIQDTSGASGYHNPTYWPNPSKTGGLLVQQFYLGDDPTTPRAMKATSYISTNWEMELYDWDGNKGNGYAMFSVFKGLELMGIPELPGVPGNGDVLEGDWWGDYAEFLVNSQIDLPTDPPQGYWPGYYAFDMFLSSSWYIIILQSTVIPCQVTLYVPAIACDDDIEVVVDYRVKRFNVTGEVEILYNDVPFDIISLEDFKGEAEKVYHLTDEQATGNHTWKVILEVDSTWSSATCKATHKKMMQVVDTPAVAGIPDQLMPFISFELDNYVTCNCDCSDIVWQATGVPADWSVTISDASPHTATVSAPEDATDPAIITFAATMTYDGVPCTGEDSALFTPNQKPVADNGKVYPEIYHVCEGGTVVLDASASYDPDGDDITFEWELNNDGKFDDSYDAKPVFDAAGLSVGSKPYVDVRVCDEHGLCSVIETRIQVHECKLTPKNKENELSVSNSHSVTVKIDEPLAHVPVLFAVSQGPNKGSTGACDPLDCQTGDDGKVKFTYKVPVESASLGKDLITATIQIPDDATMVKTVTKKWVDTIPPVATCTKGPNPSGNVPGPKVRKLKTPETPMKKKTKAKKDDVFAQNPSGFYTIKAKDNVFGNDEIQLFVYDDGSKVVFPLNSNTGYSNPTNIKYTEANGATPSERSGQGEVDWNLKGQGDAWAFAVDGQGNEGKMVPCLVPPPPK